MESATVDGVVLDTDLVCVSTAATVALRNGGDPGYLNSASVIVKS